MTVLRSDSTIEEAMEMILRHCRTGLAVVGADGRVAGFLSEEDIINKIVPNYIRGLKNPAFLPDCGQMAKRFEAVRDKRISEIMHRDVIFFHGDDSGFTAASRMIRDHIKIAPVLDEDHRLIGYITRAYIIREMIRGGRLKDHISPRYE